MPDARSSQSSSEPDAITRLAFTLSKLNAADACVCGGSRGHAGWLLCALTESTEDAETPVRGSLGRHVRNSSRKVDAWPDASKPADLREGS